jgi:hypothetical protein
MLAHAPSRFEATIRLLALVIATLGFERWLFHPQPDAIPLLVAIGLMYLIGVVSAWHALPKFTDAAGRRVGQPARAAVALLSGLVELLLPLVMFGLPLLSGMLTICAALYFVVPTLWLLAPGKLHAWLGTLLTRWAEVRSWRPAAGNTGSWTREPVPEYLNQRIHGFGVLYVAALLPFAVLVLAHASDRHACMMELKRSSMLATAHVTSIQRDDTAQRHAWSGPPEDEPVDFTLEYAFATPDGRPAKSAMKKTLQVPKKWAEPPPIEVQVRYLFENPSVNIMEAEFAEDETFHWLCASWLLAAAAVGGVLIPWPSKRTLPASGQPANP